MPIDVECDNCRRAYRLKDELNGKKFKCKECGAIVVATPIGQTPPKPAPRKAAPRKPAPKKAEPAAKKASTGRSVRPAGPASSSSAEERPQRKQAAARPKKKSPQRKRKPQPPPETYDDDELFGDGFDDYGSDYDDYDVSENPYADDFDSPPPRAKKKKRGKKKSSSGGGFSIGFNINRLNIIMVAGAVGLIVMGVNESRLASKSGATPTEVTLTDLLSEGAGGNIYLTVTNVEPTADDGSFVYEERSRNSGRYSRVWIPCRPQGTQGNRSRFILYSTDANDEFAVGGLMQSRSHTGMITNDIRSLGSEEKKLLNQIPGVNASDAFIFEIGRAPSGAGAIFLYFAAAAVVGLGGLAWIFLVPGAATTSHSIWTSESASSSSSRSRSSSVKAKPMTVKRLLFSFEGRVGRGRYWLANLGLVGGAVVATILFMTLGAAGGGTTRGIALVICTIVWLAVIYSVLAVQVKRWHDRDKTGWMALICLIPYVGLIWVTIECGLLDGTPGGNRFGPPSK